MFYLETDLHVSAGARISNIYSYPRMLQRLKMRIKISFEAKEFLL